MPIFRKVAITATLVIAFLACDPPSAPTPPPPTTSTTTAPPPHNPGAPFSWEGTRGILWFPGTQADAGQIEAVHTYAKAQGWPRITWHVCSETVEWEGTPWLDAPWGDVFGDENLTALRRFLDVTAHLGDQVLLDVFCTVRDNHGWMSANWEMYLHTLAEIVREYEHVAIHVANEPWHPSSWLRTDLNAKLRRAKEILRSGGFMGLVGADDNIGCPGCSFTYGLNEMDWADFHPYRNPNPTRAALRRIYQANRKPVVISEPVAYSAWRDGACCTANRAEVQRYICDGEAEGIVMFYHSTDGLEGLTFSWLPGAC